MGAVDVGVLVGTRVGTVEGVPVGTLVGDFVMTQNNICVPKENRSIALGDWSFDEHMTGKYAVPDGSGGHMVTLEGNFWPSIADGCNNPASPYGPGTKSRKNAYNVPYDAIVPKRGTGANLLVPVCLSASAVAYSSTRIESMFMYVGTAAGVAAKQLVAKTAATVQDVRPTKRTNGLPLSLLFLEPF